MNKKLATIFSIIIVLVFIGYMIFDTIKKPDPAEDLQIVNLDNSIEDAWEIDKEFKIREGTLNCVAVSPSGNIYLGGDSFVSGYNNDMELNWNIKTPSAVTAIAVYGDTLYAATLDMVLIISRQGKILAEWGPFEDKSLITSITANGLAIAFADAGNQSVFILDKGGEVTKRIGMDEGHFIIPSPYFDVALDSAGFLYSANTGHRRLETRDTKGLILSYFGEPGTAPDAFCGCCNPAHFVKTKTGYITSEKGINRIKILGESGEFIEFVSSKNDFIASVPLDIASADGKIIYAANPYDSKLYIFKRK